MQDNKILNLTLKLVPMAIMVVGGILTLFILFQGDDAFIVDPSLQDVLISPFFYLGYAVFIIVTVAATAFPIYHIITQPKGLVKLLTGIGALVVVTLLAYIIASDNLAASESVVASVTPGESRWIGTGIIAFYILAIVAIAVTIYMEVSRFFK